MSIFKGSGVAIITPFNEQGIDFKKLEELIEWHIESSTDAIVVCGTTGESATMSDQEKKETIKFTVDMVNKRIYVVDQGNWKIRVFDLENVRGHFTK